MRPALIFYLKGEKTWFFEVKKMAMFLKSCQNGLKSTDMNKNVIFSLKIPNLMLKGLTGSCQRIRFGPSSTGQA